MGVAVSSASPEIAAKRPEKFGAAEQAGNQTEREAEDDVGLHSFMAALSLGDLPEVQRLLIFTDNVIVNVLRIQSAMGRDNFENGRVIAPVNYFGCAEIVSDFHNERISHSFALQ